MNWDWAWGFDFSDFGPRAGWRGPRRGFFRSGEVRLALLSLLAEAPGHGYELMKRLEERSGGLYQASAGTVYPVLQQLEDEGLVRSREEAGRRVYEITSAGRDELKLHSERVERIWRRAGKWREFGCHVGPETVEVAAAIGRLTKSAFTATTAGGEEAGERVIKVLKKATKELDALR